MKHIILFSLIFFALFTKPLHAQDAIETYFDRYMEDEDFMVVYISSKMFSMVSKLDIELDDPEAEVFLEMVSDLKGIRILSTEVNAGNYYKDAVKSINTTSYETLMTVRDEGENVRILIKEDIDGDIGELLLLIGGSDEFMLMSIIGKIDLDKISQLSKQLNIDGVEHLEKIEN